MDIFFFHYLNDLANLSHKSQELYHKNGEPNYYKIVYLKSTEKSHYLQNAMPSFNVYMKTKINRLYRL